MTLEELLYLLFQRNIFGGNIAGGGGAAQGPPPTSLPFPSGAGVGDVQMAGRLPLAVAQPTMAEPIIIPTQPIPMGLLAPTPVQQAGTPPGYYWQPGMQSGGMGTAVNLPPPTPLEPAPDYLINESGGYGTGADVSKRGIGIGGGLMSEADMAGNYQFNQLVGSGVPEPEAAALALDYAKAIERTAADTSLARAQLKATTDLNRARIKSETDLTVSENKTEADKYAANIRKEVAQMEDEKDRWIAGIVQDTSLSRDATYALIKFANQVDPLSGAPIHNKTEREAYLKEIKSGQPNLRKSKEEGIDIGKAAEEDLPRIKASLAAKGVEAFRSGKFKDPKGAVKKGAMKQGIPEKEAEEIAAASEELYKREVGLQ